jgi:ferredoxin-NADP reductase
MSNQVRLKVVEIRNETADVKTFVLRPESGPLAYDAGQSMTLLLPVDGRTLLRTFSIASAPGRGDTIAMTIKAHPQGVVTRWMHRHLSIGDMIEGQAPRGRFRIADRRTGRLALISAGSGASPLMAMLRHLADTAVDTDVFWLHWARTPADILFAGELAELQNAHSRLKVAIAVTQASPGWFGFIGRPSRQLLAAAAPDLGRREVYCCGPTGFMDEMRLIHAAEGGDRDQFHIEHFGAVAEPVADPSRQSTASFTVQFRGRTFGVRGDETILAAATRQNIVIPCGCASGICGTCRVKLVAGDVAMRHNGGISAEDEAARYILACSSRPVSDIVIEVSN